MMELRWWNQIHIECGEMSPPDQITGIFLNRVGVTGPARRTSVGIPRSIHPIASGKNVVNGSPPTGLPMIQSTAEPGCLLSVWFRAMEDGQWQKPLVTQEWYPRIR